MKYLIVVIVVALALWMLASGRRARRRARRAPATATSAHQEMVQCNHCGVHLPRAEALIGDGGTYCGEEHRLAGPRRQ